MMKTIVLAAVLICCTGHAMAQFSVKGLIGDGESFLPGVNVTLFRDSTLLGIAQTDTSGQYVLSNLSIGHYNISCSLVGYDPVTSPVDVTGERNAVEVPVILMHESVSELHEVEVTANRLSVDQQLDRLVVRPSEDLTYAGNSVLDVLQKTRGVVLNRQTGSISVNGKSGVRVLINDKPVQVPLEVVLHMLEGMNASQVERIELIAVPASNYDAEGAAGIINIITDSSSTPGTDGSVMLVAGARWAETLGFSGSLNYRAARSAYFLDYSITRNHNQHIMRMHREMMVGDTPVTSSDDSPRENITNQQNISVGGEWNLGSRSVLNVALTGYSRDWKLDATAHNITLFGSDSIRETTLQAKETNLWRSVTGSLGLQHQVTASRKVEVTLDYLYYHNHNPSRYAGNMPDADELELSKETPIRVVVASAQTVSSDRQKSFSWDAGVKAAISSFDNNVTVDRLNHGEWTSDERFLSRSSMRERVLAAFVSTIWRIPAGWDATLGLRYEHTHTVIDAGEEYVLERDYGNFFPQVSFRRNLSNAGEFYFGYNRRINRPTYNDMAPYVFFWSADSFSSGNTFLLPALADVFTSGYRRGAWGLVVAYSHAGRAIAQMQPETADGSSLILRSQNLKFLNTFSVAGSYATGLFSWWDINAELSVQHQVASTSNLPINAYRPLWGVNVNASSTFKLPRAFTLEFSGTYQSRSLSGISDFLPFGSLNVGIGKQVGKNGSLKLAVDDLLYTSAWRIRTNSPDNNLNVNFDYDWHNRFVRLSYTWTPGRKNATPRKVMNGSTEERQRVNP